jgi:hypothetical protein
MDAKKVQLCPDETSGRLIQIAAPSRTGQRVSAWMQCCPHLNLGYNYDIILEPSGAGELQHTIEIALRWCEPVDLPEGMLRIRTCKTFESL